MDNQRPIGPVAPTADARVVQRPLGIDAVTLTGGVFGDWQRINREATIPLGLTQMEESGALPNLRLAGGPPGSHDASEFQGFRFQDSDLYKQLEAVSWELGRSESEDLREFVRVAVDVLTAAQQEDGYLNSYYQVVHPEKRYQEVEHSHELYCAGHLFQAAVASARTTGDDALLTIAVGFADHLVDTFWTREDTDGHPEVETALVELFRLTGTKAYLELAAKLVDRRGNGTISVRGYASHYLQDHLPVRKADSVVGHAVRQLYLEAGIVDVYLETGDKSLLDCSVRRWDDMVATKTYITGGLGSRHSQESFGDRYELPPDRAYNETCAAIASIQWSYRLLLATGERKYADLIERTLFNAFAASTSADGTRFFYVNPLQRRADHVEGDDPGRRSGWFSCACCPPNIMRLVSSLGSYLATTTSDTLVVHQYLPSKIRTPALTLDVTTNYPWDGQISFTVKEAAGHHTLRLRIPEWSKTYLLTVNGTAVEPAEPAEPSGSSEPDGYVSLSREWTPGDMVMLSLDLTPRLVVPHHRVDAVRGCGAVERGPLVYCFEQIDQTKPLEDLAIQPTTELDMQDTEIELDGVLREANNRLYTTGKPTTATPVKLRAIPYFQWDNRDGGAMRVWMPLVTQ